MSKFDIISTVLAMSASDALLTFGSERVVFGRNDGKIGIVDEVGKIKILNPGNILNVPNGAQGSLTIPTQVDDVILQWGKSAVTADSVVTLDFPVPYPKSCFFIIGSHQENDTLAAPPMIKAISRTQFTVSIVGGKDREVISWFALGV